MNKVNEIKKAFTEKISFLQLSLLLLSTVCFIIANIISGKQFDMPFNLPDLPCAVFIFPMTYILSDVFSEVYGYRWSRAACYFAFVLDMLVVGFFQLAIRLPIAGGDMATQSAWNTVLVATPVLLAASMAGFLLGDLVNDKVFRALKKKHPEVAEKFFGRAILSSLAGECVDTLIFIPTLYIYLNVSFGVPFNIATVASIIVMQLVFKVSYEIVTYPLTKVVVKKVAKYENKLANVA